MESFGNSSNQSFKLMDKHKPYKKANLKKMIEDVLDDLPKPKVSDRQVKFWRGCKTNGMREGFTHCGDKTCVQCNYMDKILKEEMLRQKDL